MSAGEDPRVPDGWVLTDAGGVPALVGTGGSASVPAVAACSAAALGADGTPVLSVVVVLSAQPMADHPSVTPLVERATLSMDVVSGLPDAALSALDRPGIRHERLFADQVHYRLCARGADPVDGTRMLTEARAAGPVGRAALSCGLERDDALAVLSALRGGASRLEVQASIDFTTAEPTRTLGLSASWAQVHDAIAARAGGSASVGSQTVEAAVADLLGDGRLQVSSSSGDSGASGDGGGDGAAGLGSTPSDARSITSALLAQSAVVLDRVDGTTWTLRERPHPALRLDYVSRVSGYRSDRIETCTPLEDILAGTLEGRSLDPFVRLVAPAPGSPGAYAPVPPRRRARSARGANRAGQIRLAVQDGRTQSLALTVEPRRALMSSAVFLAASTARPTAAVQLSHLPLDDMVLVSPGSRPESLPVVDDPDAPVWKDRVDAGIRWYLPGMELVLPRADAPVAEGPFLFRFRRTGTTDDGRPALQGTARLTVRRVVPGRAVTAAEGRSLRELTPVGVCAALEVPFVDRVDGKAKRQVLDGTVTETGDGYRVEVPMLNDWLRLTYRALSGADPLAEPASLRLDYTFGAYVPVRRADILLTFAGTKALTPVLYAGAGKERSEWVGPVGVASEVAFDPVALSLRGPVSQTSFRREVVEVAGRRSGTALTGRPAAPGGVLPAPVTTLPALAVQRPQPAVVTNAVTVARPLVVAAPALRPAPLPTQDSEQSRLARRTIARRTAVPASVPCTTFGSGYRESTVDGEVAVGCRDELQLGSVRYAMFSEVASLTTERFSVYRLLQQPGRFMLRPAGYGITRHDGDPAERAYRPCVVLYAVIDPDEAANNRIVLDATLQPDLAVHERDQLTAALQVMDPEPQVRLPTEVEGVSVDFAWSMSGAATDVSTVVLPGGMLRVSVDCDLADWMLLRLQLERSSVSGTVTFTFPDASVLRSSMVLSLTTVLGPWESGPVEARLSGQSARLVNRLDRGVDVAELICIGTAGRSSTPVAKALAGGGTALVDVPAGTSEVVPVVSLPRGDPVVIEESRSFIDHVQTNVVFVNLVSLAARGLARLEVVARLRDSPGEQVVQLTDEVAAVEVRFVLPLTTFLAGRVLEYRVSTVSTVSTEVAGEDWTTWDIASKGNIVSLTWELVDPASQSD